MRPPHPLSAGGEDWAFFLAIFMLAVAGVAVAFLVVFAT